VITSSFDISRWRRIAKSAASRQIWQASTVLKGFASAFGFGDALKAARQARRLAAAIGSPYCIV